MKDKILSIHYLRGIAAIAVVFFHFNIYLDNAYVQPDLGWILFGGGAFGVDLFFMISGFVILLSTQNTSSKTIFVIRRFFRIYPAFIIVFIIGAFTVFKNESAINLIRAAFFIHRDYTKDSPGFGYNILGPAWTLAYEIYFYFLFVAAMAISHRHRALVSSLLIILPIAVLQLVYTGSLSLGGKAAPQIPLDMPVYGLLRFISSPILIEFVIGMGFYLLFKNLKVILNSRCANIILALCCGFFLTFYFDNYKDNEFGLYGFGIWSVFLLSGFLIYDRYVGFKYHPLLAFLGDISFSVYISHYLLINAVAVYNPQFFASLTGIAKFMFMVTSATTIGIIIHFCIEKPFILVGKTMESTIKRKIITS